MPLIKLFFEICLFRRGPQDVPASKTLLGLVAAVYFIVGLIFLGLEADISDAVVQVLTEAAMMAIFLWGTLAFAGLIPRFLQSLIAMLGTDALISALAVPLVIWSPKSPDGQFALVGLTLMMFWHLAVVANIFRHALSRSLGMGLCLAIIYVVASFRIMMMLFAPGE
jgi:hypothetical protein